MRSNPKYFIYQDLIGVKLYAKNKFNITWSEYKDIGLVIDETKNTLLLQQGTEIKRYIKNHFIFFCFILP